MRKPSIFLALAFILAVFASFWLGSSLTRKRYERALNRPDTVTITKWVRDTVYQPKDSFIVRWQTAYLPVHDTTFYAVHDTTHTTDSVLVEVPISEKVYEGENYRATIRGYQVELADIWIRRRETIVTVPYRKHWTWTIGPQAGFGITPEGWRPYAGFGATFGYSF